VSSGLVARDGFVKAPRAAHRWVDELLSGPTKSIESLAVRESKSERSIRMTLSLAFPSPVLAEAAMEGPLPCGFSVRRPLTFRWGASRDYLANSGAERERTVPLRFAD
jgi:hypothetical protein